MTHRIMRHMKIRQDVQAEQEIKKSRFICRLHRCSSEQEARDWFKQVRREYPDATHHCTAMRIGSVVRSSDDGEPAGTAGRPMLDVLEGMDLDDVAAVVIRYFGGTLLGKGGLVRAYSSSVRLAAEQAELMEVRKTGFYQLSAGYEWTGKLEAFFRSSAAVLLETEYGQEAIYYFLSEEDLTEELQALSSGMLKPVFIEEMDSEVPVKSHN